MHVELNSFCEQREDILLSGRIAGTARFSHSRAATPEPIRNDSTIYPGFRIYVTRQAGAIGIALRMKSLASSVG